MTKLDRVGGTSRIPVNVLVEMAQPRSSQRIGAELREISRTGCRIVCARPFLLGDRLLVTIDVLEPCPAAVASSAQGSFRLSFQEPLDHSIAEHYARMLR